MDAKEKVLATMKEAGQPLNAGKTRRTQRSRPQRGGCSHEAVEGRGRNRLSCSLQMGTCRVMVQDSTTYYVWIGGSCDYGHKERAGGAAVVIEHDGSIISRDVISDLHTTEFRMMLTLMVKVMNELPEGSDILFLTNAAYIQNFDKTPTAKSANPDLISRCIEAKTRHNSVSVKIVPYHKSPLLIETHDMATEAMVKTRKEYHHDIQ